VVRVKYVFLWTRLLLGLLTLMTMMLSCWRKFHPIQKLLVLSFINDDLDGGSGLVTDIGLYNGGTKFTDTDGSATVYAAEQVIDRDCYATLSTDLRAAVTAGTEFRFETLNINSIANFVWEDGGLTSDPGVPLRVTLTIETVAGSAAAGDITMVVQYVVN